MQHQDVVSSCSRVVLQHALPTLLLIPLKVALQRIMAGVPKTLELINSYPIQWDKTGAETLIVKVCHALWSYNL